MRITKSSKSFDLHVCEDSAVIVCLKDDKKVPRLERNEIPIELEHIAHDHALPLLFEVPHKAKVLMTQYRSLKMSFYYCPCAEHKEHKNCIRSLLI